jgi:hypothetical protein
MQKIELETNVVEEKIPVQQQVQPEKVSPTKQGESRNRIAKPVYGSLRSNNESKIRNGVMTVSSVRTSQ